MGTKESFKDVSKALDSLKNISVPDPPKIESSLAEISKLVESAQEPPVTDRVDSIEGNLANVMTDKEVKEIQNHLDSIRLTHEMYEDTDFVEGDVGLDIESEWPGGKKSISKNVLQGGVVTGFPIPKDTDEEGETVTIEVLPEDER